IAQANIWLGGGVNFSKMRKVYANENVGQDDSFRTGFNAELSLQQHFRNKINIVSRIVYDSKGYKTTNHTRLSFKTHYLDFYPSSLQYYYPFKEHSKMYAITGPYFGIGLFCKEENNNENGTLEEDIDWGKIELERFDIGWNFGIGYEFKQLLQCELGYDMGLKNITENTNKDLKLRNHAVKLTLKVSLSQLIFPLFKSNEKDFSKNLGLIKKE
ncbi:MAG: porin family protein, partial [Bacteroidales bacterium]|nr:porin family protein [Bacteroidales bacterium]